MPKPSAEQHVDTPKAPLAEGKIAGSSRSCRRRDGASGAALLWLSLLFCLSGCGLGLLQTAKTTPKGQVDITLGAGYIHNELNEARDGISLSNLPAAVSVRLGATEQLDLGARLFFLAGLLADAKYNLLPAESPWALSVQLGLGGAVDLDDNHSKVLHLPLNLLASYTVVPQFTPYAAIGYGAYWIFGRDEDKQEGRDYADREGHGDGLLQVTAGVQLANARQTFAFFLEYNYWQPVVDDPGDFYEFVSSHFLMGGYSF